MTRKREGKPVPIPVDPGTQDVPLRLALALCLAEDVEEGLAEIDRSTGTVRDASKGYALLKLLVTQLAFMFALLALAGLLIGLFGRLPGSTIFAQAFLIAVIAAVLPWLVWHFYQYGIGIPNEPRSFGKVGDRRIDDFLARLHRESGPRAYTYSALFHRRVPLNRRVFFSRLRYLLFSEHGAVRMLVTRFPMAFPVPADIFLDSADVAALVGASKPKRKGGPGRDPKYPYLDAVIDLIGDPAILSLDLGDESGAQQKVETKLLAWFEENADESGDMPRHAGVAPYAAKVVARLEMLRD